jgi:DNA-binding transcriptional regulator YdaS (Cro superfamily)
MIRTPIPSLKDWLAKSTKEAQEAVASRAGSSRNYLFQLSGGHRRAGPEKAKAIEEATGGELQRTDLCEACGRCELALKAKQQ